ncbi:MAG: hypothetical protein ACI4MJ_03345 [Aristaeellaceae bacterium]
MYKLLLATDRPEVQEAFQKVAPWEGMGFRAPRMVTSAEEAVKSLACYHADAIAFALPEDGEARLMDALLKQYPCLPICQAGHTPESVEHAVRELGMLLNRIHADYSDDDTTEMDMLQLCRHKFFRALIGGQISSRQDVLRYLRLLRSRMDPGKSAVLVELALPKDDEFLRNRWHYGVDRLEVALRNFFGAELAGMRILVSVLPDDRIYLLCCTMLGEAGPGADVDMTQLIIDHAQDSMAHVREYLGMDLRLASIRVLPTLVNLAQA